MNVTVLEYASAKLALLKPAPGTGLLLKREILKRELKHLYASQKLHLHHVNVSHY